MKKKRLLSSFIIAILLVLQQPLTAKAANVFIETTGNYKIGVSYFNVNPQILAYVGPEVKRLVLPTIFTSPDNTHVDEPIYNLGIIGGQDFIEEVVIPSTYKTSAECCFMDMAGLKRVVFEGNNNPFQMGGGDVFRNDANLVYVNIPDSVTFIGSDSFYGCTSLKELRLPKMLQFIDLRMFYNCTSLEKLTIFDEIIEISSRGFENCTNLKELTIPGSKIVSLGECIFDGCPNLKTVYTGSEMLASYITANYPAISVVDFQVKEDSIKDVVRNTDGTYIQTPIVTDFKGVPLSTSEYSVSYESIGGLKVNCVIKGKNNHQGTIKVPFTAYAGSMEKCTITNDPVTYNGQEQIPAFTVKYGSKTLVANRDYQIEKIATEDYKNQGKKSIRFIGMGDYAYDGNEAIKSFIISPKTLVNSMLTVLWGSLTYSVRDRQMLTPNIDYIGNITSTECTVVGQGNYVGTLTASKPTPTPTPPAQPVIPTPPTSPTPSPSVIPTGMDYSSDSNINSSDIDLGGSQISNSSTNPSVIITENTSDIIKESSLNKEVLSPDKQTVTDSSKLNNSKKKLLKKPKIKNIKRGKKKLVCYANKGSTLKIKVGNKIYTKKCKGTSVKISLKKPLKKGQIIIITATKKNYRKNQRKYLVR